MLKRASPWTEREADDAIVVHLQFKWVCKSQEAAGYRHHMYRNGRRPSFYLWDPLIICKKLSFVLQSASNLTRWLTEWYRSNFCNILFFTVSVIWLQFGKIYSPFSRQADSQELVDSVLVHLPQCCPTLSPRKGKAKLGRYHPCVEWWNWWWTQPHNWKIMFFHSFKKEN